MNTQKLLDPEVREIAFKLAKLASLYGPVANWGVKPNEHTITEDKLWQHLVDLINRESRKPIFKTCIEDGEQDVFEGDDYFFIWDEQPNKICTSTCTTNSRLPDDTLRFKSHENAVNYLCKNYKFTVEEIWNTIRHYYGNTNISPLERSFINSAKQALNL